MSARAEAIALGLIMCGVLAFFFPQLAIAALIAFWFSGMLD